MTHSTPTRVPFALLTVTFGIALVGWVGCVSTGPNWGSENPETEDPETASFDVRLTDAPGDVVQAIVTIERVAVVPADDASDGDARDGGIDLLSDSAFTADLVTLQAGVDTALASTDSLPPGTYGQIRLVTADAAHVLYETARGDSARAELKQPSASESGIKINFHPVTLEHASDRVEVTLDFSVEDSFVKAGQSGKFIFKPVVQATSVTTGDSSGN